MCPFLHRSCPVFFSRVNEMSSSGSSFLRFADDAPLRWLHLSLLVLMLGAATPLLATEPATPTPDDLLLLARKWSSKDDNIQSFEIAGQVENTFKFHLVRLQTGEAALYTSCSHDGVPVLAIVNGSAIVWDALRRQVIVVTNIAPGFALKTNEDDGTPGFSAYAIFAPEPALKDGWLELDLPAVFDYASNDRKIEMLGDRRYKLTGTTKKGGTETIWFDQNRPQPIERLEATNKNGEPVWEVSRLRINQKFKVQLPPLPTKQQMGEHFEVIELDGAKVGAPQQEALTQRLTRSYLLRAALDKDRPESFRNMLLEAIEKAERRRIDWRALAKTDAIDAKHISELVVLPELSKNTD